MSPGPVNRRTALVGIAGVGISGAGIVSGELAGRGTAPSAGQPGTGACDFLVSPGDSIQATVESAEPGDTICVEPGTYEEAVTVDVAAVTLRATHSRAAVIDATGLGTGVRIEAEGVTVEGFEIVGDDGTTSGLSINTTAGATAGITVRDNHVHGMAKGGGGGPFGVASWGLLSWGDAPLSGVLVEDNRIEDIGGDHAGLPVGIGIGLEEVQGDRPRAGAVVRRNGLRDVYDARVEVLGRGVTLPGVGIAVQPLDGESSGAGDPATDVHRNTITDVSVDVVLGEVGLTRVQDNE